MRFSTQRKRPAPSVIIVSLIDVLMVVLIFLMVSTAFKQTPSVRLALPESRQSTPGAAERNLVVTIAPTPPHLYIGDRAVTLDRLQSELAAAAARNPQVQVAIRADTAAPFGEVIRVMDAAKAANIRTVDAFTRSTAR